MAKLNTRSQDISALLKDLPEEVAQKHLTLVNALGKFAAGQRKEEEAMAQWLEHRETLAAPLERATRAFNDLPDQLTQGAMHLFEGALTAEKILNENRSTLSFKAPFDTRQAIFQKMAQVLNEAVDRFEAQKDAPVALLEGRHAPEREAMAQIIYGENAKPRTPWVFDKERGGEKDWLMEYGFYLAGIRQHAYFVQVAHALLTTLPGSPELDKAFWASDRMRYEGLFCDLRRIVEGGELEAGALDYFRARLQENREDVSPERKGKARLHP